MVTVAGGGWDCQKHTIYTGITRKQNKKKGGTHLWYTTAGDLFGGGPMSDQPQGMGWSMAATQQPRDSSWQRQLELAGKSRKQPVRSAWLNSRNGKDLGRYINVNILPKRVLMTEKRSGQEGLPAEVDSSCFAAFNGRRKYRKREEEAAGGISFSRQQHVAWKETSSEV